VLVLAIHSVLQVSPSTTASTPAPTPTSTLTTEEYYRLRNWAWPTPTRTPWPRILPCETGGSDVLRDWVQHWHTWIELYRERGYHDLPAEVILSVIMQESRGDPDARGGDGEIGIMQVLPSSVPATAGQLEQSSKNLYHGIGLLESYTWEAQAVVDGTTAEYRKVLYSAVPAASELGWWYGPDGQTALAMYQCGPGNIREGGSCGRFGGYVYASTVMGCWAPWVQEVLYGEPTPTPWPTLRPGCESHCIDGDCDVVCLATPAPTFLPATATWTPSAPRASVVPTQPAPVEAPSSGVSAGTILVLTGFSVLAVMVYTVAYFVRTKN
jgi:hypothetical protein